MSIHDLLRTAMNALAAHRLRSALTMLGIVIGVGAVVLMVSAGRTVQGYILDQIQSLGGSLVDVFPVGLEKFGRPTDTIKEDDYRAVLQLATVESVAPVVLVREAVSYGTEVESPHLVGTNPNFFRNYSLKISEGRILAERDVERGNAVVVLGADPARDLFGGRNPLGKKVKIGPKSFEVVGVLEAAGSLLLQDLDRHAYIPFTTAKSLTGQKHLDLISTLATGDPDLAIADMTSLLRARHKIENPEEDPDKDDFLVRSAAQATEIVGTVTLGLTIFLGLIAGISLVVGGIGIMNIMLVSVSERTMEIGLRKALGARRRDILFQFLIEAATLTSLGGIIGITGGAALGFLLSLIAEHYLGSLRFVLSFSALLSAFAMAVGTGLAFGIYPARRAAALTPMEAMRRE